MYGAVPVATTGVLVPTIVGNRAIDPAPATEITSSADAAYVTIKLAAFMVDQDIHIEATAIVQDAVVQGAALPRVAELVLADVSVSTPMVTAEVPPVPTVEW